MVKTSVPSRVLSVALAAALCCTMMPVQGIAHAAESNDAITQNAAEDTAAESQSADAESAEPQASEAASADPAPGESDVDAAAARVNEDIPVAQGAATTEGASSNADIEITRTSVTLGEQAATVFSHNGIVFQVNADDPDTAACIGWTDRAPEGDLQIPEQAIAAGKAYPVTRIMTGGGF